MTTRTNTTDNALKLYADMLLFQQNRGYAPSIREVADMLGINSTSHARYYLDVLEAWGWIARAPGKGRAIRLLHKPDQADAHPVARTAGDAKTCAVPGCSEPRWAGPKGMNLRLTKCETHQRREWRDAKTRQRYHKPAPPRREVEPRVEKPPRPAKATRQPARVVTDPIEQILRALAVIKTDAVQVTPEQAIRVADALSTSPFIFRLRRVLGMKDNFDLAELRGAVRDYLALQIGSNRKRLYELIGEEPPVVDTADYFAARGMGAEEDEA